MFGEQPSAAKWNILGTNDAAFNNGTGLPNGVAVNQSVGSITSIITTTTAIPFDDTIPQNTEGVEVITASITPVRTTDILIITAQVFMSIATAADNLSIALFQDTTANALAATSHYQTTATAPTTVVLKHKMAAGTTTATTFKVRAGGNTTNTVTINGQSGARRFGGVGESSLTVEEYKA